MFARTQHQRPAFLRVFVLTLFALVLMLRPVLAAAGEIHELEHDPSGQHLILDFDGPETGLDTEPDNDADSELLHLLLQCAHCCGSAAPMVPVFKSMTMSLAADRVLARAPQPQRAARLPAPFKPPIFA